MGFLNNIFGKPKEETIDDYMKNNQLPVTFSKLYYKYPDKRVPIEGQKEYSSFDDFVVDFPHLRFHEYELKNAKHIKISSGYFFYYRGYFYYGKSIEDCLSKKIGYYINEKLQFPKELKIILPEKKHFDNLFSNSPCFVMELGEDLKINVLSFKHKGVVNASTKSSTNRYSTLSIGSINDKPITFGDKILLINMDGHNFKSYLPNEFREHDVPLFAELYYGHIIDHEYNGTAKGIPIVERLLRKKHVVVDFLRYDKINIGDYLDSFKKQSRKKKLEKIMRINNEL